MPMPLFLGCRGSDLLVRAANPSDPVRNAEAKEAQLPLLGRVIF
jgi:hypothetical protein